MKIFFRAAMAAIAICAYGQTPKLEFEVASIKAVAPPTGFFHASDSGSGGPGSSDPGRFHCASCTLSTLITRAFELQRYQFPAQQSLPNDAFEISARIPDGTSPEQFLVMLQTFLKDRFGLAYHYDKKEMQGYQLVVAKNGPKLKESDASPEPAKDRDAHKSGDWRGGDHSHPGLISINGQARYRGDHQTIGELARVLSNQLAKPVDDQTGLTGKYDIRLSWSGEAAQSGNHAEGAGHMGGDGHGDHGGAPSSGDPSGPTLFGALQSELGLKLVPAPKATARIFVIDHVEKSPTAN